MADNRSQAQRSSEAASLLEKLAPYLDALEAEEMKAALASEYWQPVGTREARHHLDCVKAYRAVRQRLETEITKGLLEAKRSPA